MKVPSRATITSLSWDKFAASLLGVWGVDGMGRGTCNNTQYVVKWANVGEWNKIQGYVFVDYTMHGNII